MTIPFAQLVALMVLGDGTPDSLAGVVRHHEPDEDWAARIYRRGRLLRRETAEGTVVRIDGADTLWCRQGDDPELTAYPRAASWSGSPLGGLDAGGERPSWSRWDGTDFTRPTGPARATSFLGRDAWAVELAPPSHKPAPIQLVVDAATGLVLRQANAHFGTATEWIELDLAPDLPDELFGWDGPTRDPEQRRAADEQELAGRSAWLAEHGIELRIERPAELLLHEWDDASGALHLSFALNAHGTLLRRPHSSEPWADEPRYPHLRRWSDARWDWLLGTTDALADAEFAAVQAQLARST